jgi:hypothetical protein
MGGDSKKTLQRRYINIMGWGEEAGVETQKTIFFVVN